MTRKQFKCQMEKEKKKGGRKGGYSGKGEQQGSAALPERGNAAEGDGNLTQCYRFRLINSPSISSTVEMILEFA